VAEESLTGTETSSGGAVYRVTAELMAEVPLDGIASRYFRAKP